MLLDYKTGPDWCWPEGGGQIISDTGDDLGELKGIVMYLFIYLDYECYLVVFFF